MPVQQQIEAAKTGRSLLSSQIVTRDTTWRPYLSRRSLEDALACSRSKASSDHTRTLVNEFLAQLDGMAGSNDRVLVLAATDVPWDVDEAMKRPGRFDRQIFVPPPDAETRGEMFCNKLIGVPTDALDTAALGARSEHFPGADIDGVIEQAKDAVLAAILESGDEGTPYKDVEKYLRAARLY